MTRIERLKTLVQGTNNPSLHKVISYLETRPDMDSYYLSEEKTPDQMWEFITKKARAQSVNNCAVIDDKIVYVWAISYFLATNEALGLNKKNTPTPSNSTPKEKTNAKKDETSAENKEINDTNKKQNQEQITLF